MTAYRIDVYWESVSQTWRWMVRADNHPKAEGWSFFRWHARSRAVNAMLNLRWQAQRDNRLRAKNWTTEVELDD